MVSNAQGRSYDVYHLASILGRQNESCILLVDDNDLIIYDVDALIMRIQGVSVET